RELNRILKPASAAVIADIHFENRWQSSEQHAAEILLACHVAADEVRDGTSATDFYRLEICGGENLAQDGCVIHHLCWAPVLDSVFVAMREYDNVAAG